MVLSERQEAIENSYLNENVNLVIQAVAGSGKTTTLMHLLSVSKYRVLFLAFNKSIQEEIEKRLVEKNLEQGKSLTLHSLGFLAIRTFYKNVSVKNGKNWTLIKEFENFHKNDLRRYNATEKLNIMYTIMDMNDVSRMFLTDSLEELIPIMLTMDKIPFECEDLQEFWNTFLQIREAHNNREDGVIEIDFIDMIYLPAVTSSMIIPIQPYYLFIDEAQDLNLAQHAFIDKLIAQGDVQKWVAVGDRYQSIYGFGGSYPESFDLFTRKENVKELPLDVCYRCPPNVIQHANEVYPILRSFKFEDGDLVDFGASVEAWAGIKKGSLVICRNSRPLITLFFKLLSLEKKAIIKGEDILGKVQKIYKANKFKTVVNTLVTLDRAMSKQRKIVETLSLDVNANKKEIFKEERKLVIMQEDYDNFEVFARQLSPTNMFGDIDSDYTMEDLYQKVLKIFNETPEEDTITLCTIHKSKGLEADYVYILNEFLIPSPFSKSAEQRQQENNLKYVARTRAKKGLYKINI